MEKIEQQVISGDYSTLHNVNWGTVASMEIPWLIAALSFSGRIDEAQAIWQLQFAKLTTKEKIATRFFLILGLIRTSQYTEARTLIAHNLIAIKQVDTARERFYVYQGLAFYRYFCGRWEQALRHSQKAFEAAIEDNFLYGKVLSSDLRGHLLVQVNNVDEGLKLLREAIRLAKLIPNPGLAQAAQISHLTYEAQYGLKSSLAVSDLQYALTELRDSDTYSRATLLLELARQLMLHGKPNEVANYLDQATGLIYMYKNRRQESILNLRWGQLSFITGDYHRALSFAQSALRCLDLRVDRAIELTALGLQQKIVNQLMLSESGERLRAEIESKSVHFGGMIHKRILRRGKKNQIPMNEKGDRLGEMLDRANSVELIQHGYLQSLYDIYQWDRDRFIIAIDLFPKITVAAYRGQLHVISHLTVMQKKFLAAIADHEKSKEQLIQEIWEQAPYHPLRHDSLIYTTVTSLRKALGPMNKWIETTEQGYRFEGEVVLLAQKNSKLNIAGAPKLEFTEALNHRQISYLNHKLSKTFIKVKDYQQLFHTSQITACRDLAMLLRLGYVLRTGRARGTRYIAIGK